MPKTSAKIIFGLFDTTARTDATVTVEDRQAFSDLADLSEEYAPESGRFATLEQDHFLLDGSLNPFPDTPAGQIRGLWSESMSDENGEFETPVVLTAAFTENHSTWGVSFAFDNSEAGDCPSSVQVRWYDAQSVCVAEKTFTPDAAECFLQHKVENFRGVEITFYGTARPYHYLKLLWIGYGVELIFAGSQIESAKLLEQLDPISAEVSVNTLDFAVVPKSIDFNPLNPKGVYSLLQQQQKIRAEELVDGEKQSLGTFYLSDWENADESGASFSAVDLLGLTDNTQFPGGMYANVTASSVVAEIMGSAGVTDYALDETLGATVVSGWIPPCTHREAIQQIAIAIGAIVDCSRSDKINLTPPPARPTAMIPKSRMFSGGKIKLKPLVTEADITAYRYTANSEATELFSGDLPAGDHEVAFDAPAHTLTATGATIVSSGANRALLRVAEAGTATLSGCGYDESKQIVARKMCPLPAAAGKNSVTVESATMVSPQTAFAVAEAVYAYYQNRYQAEIEILPSEEKPGDYVILDGIRGEKLKGVIESMELDLTGGFLAAIRLCGVRIETTGFDCAGELYAGDTVGVV